MDLYHQQAIILAKNHLIMKNSKCFDIHDKDVTPEIYILLFSEAFVEIVQNDMWYKINPFGFPGDLPDEDDSWKIYPATGYVRGAEGQFQKQIERGPDHCYHDNDAMKNLCENPSTCAEALNRFKAWLTERGVTNNDTLFVKIWW